MPRVPTLPCLTALVLALWPLPGQAQEGPSFNCRYAQTATEHAICNSPELSQIEMEMYGAYLRLVEAVGQRRARSIADDYLERRQACGNDEACIAERLRVTQLAFEHRAGDPPESRSASLPAEAGPSFDCDQASTSSERAICGNADLSRMEREMHADYLRLVEALGERRARRVADRFLQRRQACGAQAACIAEQLRVAQRVFERRAGGPDDAAPGEMAVLSTDNVSAPPLRPERFGDLALAFLDPDLGPDERPGGAPAHRPEDEVGTREPELADRPAPEPLPEPWPEDLAAAAPAAPEPLPEITLSEPEPPLETDLAALAPPRDEAEIPLAAQAPLPPDLRSSLREAPARMAAAEPDPTEPPSEMIAGAELTAAGEPAPFDTPVSWAFMDLIRHQRAVIQERLRSAGLYEGSADGTWDRATLDALQAFLASEEGQGFDASTEGGATLALDYIRSDAFAQVHGLATESEEAAATAGADPLASTDW